MSHKPESDATPARQPSDSALSEELTRLARDLADRYAIQRELGRGGMATVYLARDLKHDRLVALKVLNPELGAVLGTERFLAEIKVTANLQHPHLLPLFDSGEANGLLFYVMPFVEGESLRARLEREKQLPVEEAVRIAVAVANALDYAHQHGVIHRDLKPENILLQHGQPVVADFGIALAVSNAGGQRVTQTGLSLGTPAYMSPEQATGDRVIDARADVYSLGTVLYELLTGEAPHTGNTAQAVIAKLMTEAPRPVTALRRTVPAHVDAAVHRALEKLPADRFATAREFADALQAMPLAGSTPPIVGGAPSTAGQRGGAPWRRSRRVMIAVGVVMLLGAGMISAWQLTANRTSPSASDVKSIAVLPFANMSADAEQEYFSDGITEELLNVLAKVPALRVAARTSAFQFKGKTVDVREVGRQLGVAHVVEGSVRKAGDRVRITAQLIDARNGYHLWSESYDREIKDVFRVQDEIAGAIAGALQVRLDARGTASTGQTTNTEAHDLYLRGRFLTSQSTEASLRAAIEHFRKAIALDSTYAAAYTGIAWAYALLADSYLPPLEAYTETRKAARRALELDPSAADARALYAYTLVFLDWDHAGAEREFRRALETNPGAADVHLLYSQVLCGAGRLTEALAEADRAVELDGLDPVKAWNSAFLRLVARDYDAVLKGDRRMAQLAPDFFYIESSTASVYRQRQMYDSALAVYRRIEPLTGGVPPLGLAVAYALTGRRAEALAIARALEERSKSRYISPERIAVVYIGLGDIDRAFEWLERAVDAHSAFFFVLQGLPDYDPVRSDPRFAALQRRMGLNPTSR